MSSRNSSSVKSSYAVFDEDWPSEPPTGIRTPPPPFDLEAFAADSECRLRACAEAERRSTAPPPPHQAYASIGPPASSAGEAAIATALLDCARRAELTRAQLRIGGLSADEAARVLRAELARVREAGVSDALGVLATSLGAAFGELGGVGEDESRVGTVVVLEDDVGLRDRLTVAIEAIGHRVCSAGRGEAVKELAAQDMVAVLVGVGEDVAGGSCWEVLRGMLPLEGVAIVIGGRGACPGLETLAADAGADDFVRFDLAIHELIEELGTIFVALGLTRKQALSA